MLERKCGERADGVLCWSDTEGCFTCAQMRWMHGCTAGEALFILTDCIPGCWMLMTGYLDAAIGARPSHSLLIAAFRGKRGKPANTNRLCTLSSQVAKALAFDQLCQTHGALGSRGTQLQP